MPQVTQAISSFLTAKKRTHNGPDLLERYLQYGPFMETQVNVAAGDGEPVDGKRSTYSDGLDTWWNIRIPKRADSDPEFKDYKLEWPLDTHAEAIGSTGWDWSARRSRWFGYDFDSITGHAAGVGIGDEELERVREAACALPWVEVRRSTGGNGLHLYVLCSEAGVPTENHTIHAALGRAILGIMSSETGFDFARHVDACGGNMWIWARKMTTENRGLSLVKAAERCIGDDELPANWRDHIEVVKGTRSKIRVSGVEDKDQDPFDALANGRRIVQLDDQHKKIIDELRRLKGSVLWVPDYHLLQTHTAMLQTLMDEHGKELGLKGFFQTNSKGKDLGQPNCFLFPLDDGAWKVYRFSQGINETTTWEQDNAGWTTCYFNHAPNLKIAARAMGGIEDAEKGGFLFSTVADAQSAAKALGRDLPIPERGYGDREVTLKAHKDGRLVAQVARREGDEGMKDKGWAAKKGYWTQVFETKADQRNGDLSSLDFDNSIRALKSASSERAGWVVADHAGEWVRCATTEARLKLLALGHSKNEADIVLGLAGEKNWKLVNLPFQPEYPGDRQWNMDAAQYRFQPAQLGDEEAPFHPHWDMILKHCGQDLDEPLKELEWARGANIKSGAEYLRMWAACMLREPYEKLPYLFFYGEQNSGKSIFHEALSLLMTKGVAAADRALTNSNDFNGELSNAVLAYIEEKDIAKSAGAYNKLKDWVTSPTIWIRKMRTDAYSQANTLHFVQCANERDALTIKPKDTRIVVMFVPSLDQGQEIPKTVLIDRLQAEAPHFMRTLVDLTLPPMLGRLRLPVVSTENKQRAEDSARTPLEVFLDEQCHEVPGEMMPFSEFFERYKAWLDEEDLEDKGKWVWKAHVSKHMPSKYPFGVYHSNQRYVGNLSFEEKAPKPDAQPIVLKDGKLKPRGK